MTEKRFYIEVYGIFDTYADKQLTWDELSDTLNDLWEENQRLQQGIVPEEIYMENHHLKQSNAVLRSEMKSAYKLCETLSDKLKGVINDVLYE